MPTDSTFSTISAGSCDTVPPDRFALAKIVVTMPCMMENSAFIRSMPYTTAPCASAKRMNAFSTCSGFFISVKLEQVLMIPMAKNRTNSPNAIAFNAPLILVITLQIEPPLKVAGSCVSSVQISFNLSFQVFNADWRFCTIQLSLSISYLTSFV